MPSSMRTKETRLNTGERRPPSGPFSEFIGVQGGQVSVKNKPVGVYNPVTPDRMLKMEVRNNCCRPIGVV